MKLTVNQLRKIIKEEVEASLAEAPGFLGRMLGGGKTASNYAGPAKALKAAYLTKDKAGYDAAVKDLYDAFEGAVARGADPESEAETLGAAMASAGFADSDVEWFKGDMKTKEFWRKRRHSREDETAAMTAAIKGLLTDPATKSELTRLVSAKASATGSAKKAASAAITRFLGEKLPGFDPVELHGLLSKLYNLR